MSDLQNVVPSIYGAVLSDVFTQDTRCLFFFLSDCVAAKIRWSQSETGCRTRGLLWPFCQPVQTGCSTKWPHPQHTTGHNLFEEGWQHQFNDKRSYLFFTERTVRDYYYSIAPATEKVIDKKKNRSQSEAFMLCWTNYMSTFRNAALWDR